MIISKTVLTATANLTEGRMACKGVAVYAKLMKDYFGHLRNCYEWPRNDGLNRFIIELRFILLKIRLHLIVQTQPDVKDAFDTPFIKALNYLLKQPAKEATEIS